MPPKPAPGKRFGKGRRMVLPGEGNPERPSRAAIERVAQLYLKNEPDIVNAIDRLIDSEGYKTVPEAIRHLLYVAISATPTDGEFRAAMSSVRSQMIQYFTIRYWHLLNEMKAGFEGDWKGRDGDAFVNREIARMRGEAPGRCKTCGHEETTA